MPRPALFTMIAAVCMATATLAGSTTTPFTAINLDKAPLIVYGDPASDKIEDAIRPAPVTLSAFVNADQAPAKFY